MKYRIKCVEDKYRKVVTYFIQRKFLLFWHPDTNSFGDHYAFDDLDDARRHIEWRKKLTTNRYKTSYIKVD